MPRKAAAVPEGKPLAEVFAKEVETAVTPDVKPVRKSKKNKLTRNDYLFCVFVGASNTPKCWAKTEEEAKEFIAGLKPSKAASVTWAALSPVTVQTSIKIGD